MREPVQRDEQVRENLGTGFKYRAGDKVMNTTVTTYLDLVAAEIEHSQVTQHHERLVSQSVLAEELPRMRVYERQHGSIHRLILHHHLLLYDIHSGQTKRRENMLSYLESSMNRR